MGKRGRGAAQPIEGGEAWNELIMDKTFFSVERVENLGWVLFCLNDRTRLR